MDKRYGSQTSFIWDIIFKGVIKVKKMSIHDNPGNIMTITIMTNTFKYCLDLINVSCTL